MENEHTPKGKTHNFQEGNSISRRDGWNSAAVPKIFSTFYAEVI